MKALLTFGARGSVYCACWPLSGSHLSFPAKYPPILGLTEITYWGRVVLLHPGWESRGPGAIAQGQSEGKAKVNPGILSQPIVLSSPARGLSCQLQFLTILTSFELCPNRRAPVYWHSASTNLWGWLLMPLPLLLLMWSEAGSFI